MSDTQDLWRAIEARRAHYQGIIDKANDTIASARALIKEAREGLDGLPVAKVRRVKKAPGRKLADEVVAEDDRTVFEAARGIERQESTDD